MLQSRKGRSLMCVEPFTKGGCKAAVSVRAVPESKRATKTYTRARKVTESARVDRGGEGGAS